MSPSPPSPTNPTKPPTRSSPPDPSSRANPGSPIATRPRRANGNGGPTRPRGRRDDFQDAADGDSVRRLSSLDPRVHDDRVAGEVFGRSSGSRASAGRVIGVGFLLFFLWTLFDANALYRSAQEGPLGARRSVAVAVLRPFAAVSNFLKLSSVVNWGDSLLGRGRGALGENQTLPTIVVPQAGSDNSLHSLSSGVTPLPHDETHTKLDWTTGPQFNVPPIVQPTATHPMTILDIGDSVGTDLGFGLGDQFTGDPYVKVIQAGQVDSGLARPDYWNWPGHLAADLKKYHPQTVIIMMGTNDDQALNQKGNSITAFCQVQGPPCEVSQSSPAWVTDYTAKIRYMMEEALASGAHVVWVGLPPMGGGNITSKFCQQINDIAADQATSLPDVTYVSSWQTLGGSKGQYVEYKRINGSEEQIRASDGVHLDPAGWDLLAHALVAPMEQAWSVRLEPSQS